MPGCHGPLQQRLISIFGNPVKFQGLLAAPPHHSLFPLPLMMNVSYVALCSYEGHLVVQRYSSSKVPTSISQTLVLFNVSTAQRSLLMASSNPPFLKETREVQRSNCSKAVCLCVCVYARACKCSTDLSGRSLTLVVTVT